MVNEAYSRNATMIQNNSKTNQCNMAHMMVNLDVNLTGARNDQQIVKHTSGCVYVRHGSVALQTRAGPWQLLPHRCSSPCAAS